MPSQKQPKGPKVKNFRISLVDDMTHKQLWIIKFTRTSLFLLVISVITVIMAVSYSLIAFTPLRTFIPGYPDGHTKRAAITNAIRIDSLRNVIYTWEFYTENLKRVMEGADPVAIDSIIRNTSAPVLPTRATGEPAETLSPVRFRSFWLCLYMDTMSFECWIWIV